MGDANVYLADLLNTELLEDDSHGGIECYGDFNRLYFASGYASVSVGCNIDKSGIIEFYDITFEPGDDIDTIDDYAYAIDDMGVVFDILKKYNDTSIIFE